MSKEKEKKEVSLNFKVPEEMHEKLRKLSFETRQSIAEICREGIQHILNKHEKKS